MKYIIKEIIDLFFPKKCFSCGKYSEDYICKNCYLKIEFISLYQSFPNKYLNGLFSATLYSGVIRDLIHKLKYNNRRSVSKPLSCIMSSFFKNEIHGKYFFECIIPVPLHRTRYRKREYNQTLLISEKISRDFGIQIEEKLLIKIKDTKEQNKLSREERFLNQKDSFKINKDNTKYGSVLIVDDIYTTGATSYECAKTLKSGGIKEVYLLTLSVRKAESLCRQ